MHTNNGLTPKARTRFQHTIYEHFSKHGRDLPWRSTSDPYRILVSEIMLQQTQVLRVLPKYQQFVSTFPDLPSLAQAPLHEILEVWQGLGYNRRALALQKTAQRLIAEYGGEIPDSIETLRTLPGIGPATAGAVVVFAFNRPAAFIETNIRRVFLHFFFAGKDGIKDREILPLVEKTLDTFNPRAWYQALMDYGVMLRKQYPNPNRRSAHYARQTPFEGSDREIRGLILKNLLRSPALSPNDLIKAVGKRAGRVKRMISQLEAEGFLARKGNRLVISSGSEERRKA